MTPIRFVCAPFFSVVRPALGISLLKAALAAQDILAEVEYLNLRFANRIGVDFHESAATGAANTLLVGEWIFSDLANGGAQPAGATAYWQILQERYAPEQFARLLELRAAARDFVEEEAQRLAALAPELLGFSTSFQQNCASLALARRVRELNPEITICFGGANCEGPMGRALLAAFPQIDYVFAGEADETFPAFARNFLARRTPYSTAPSVYARSAPNTSSVATPAVAKPYVENLDALPAPDFTEYFATLAASDFAARVRPGLIFESSRGCWWGAKKHCRFCGLNGESMRYRAKSPDRVMTELAQLAGQWSVNQFLAADNIMAMPHVESVFGRSGEPPHAYRFFYEIKSNLTRQQLAQLARGGVNWVQPGIESLDDELLRSMEKGVTALQNICLLRNCAELGLRATWTILHGFPGETAQQYARMAAWLPLLEHLEPPQGCTPLRLDRFSPYCERAAEFGWQDLQPVAAYRAVYAVPEKLLNGLAYYFEGKARAPLSADDLAPLQQAVEQWNKRFFNVSGPPVLAATNFGVAPLIEDTRACAAQRWRCLSAAEAAVLQAFREPKNIEAALQPFGSAEARTAFDRLAAWRYLLLDGARALSLVTEAGDTKAMLATEFPGGSLLPPAKPQ